ncbi:MAG: nuclear transport factor 2 family protein [Nitriliruptorales bacterium]
MISAVVAELKRDHPEFRVYYSQWPLLGKHTVRPPILKDSGVKPEGWPAKYHAALTAGDADAIAEAFEPGGYFREPSGADFVHGGDDLHPFFKMFFSAGGGIHLEHCAITDDGTRCCLEYNCVQWGDVKIPPQAGIGVYERAPSGKLRAARVYDDVEPPEFAQLGIAIPDSTKFEPLRAHLRAETSRSF